jgi:hypothetical protein
MSISTAVSRWNENTLHFAGPDHNLAALDRTDGDAKAMRLHSHGQGY